MFCKLSQYLIGVRPNNLAGAELDKKTLAKLGMLRRIKGPEMSDPDLLEIIQRRSTGLQ